MARNKVNFSKNIFSRILFCFPMHVFGLAKISKMEISDVHLRFSSRVKPRGIMEQRARRLMALAGKVVNRLREHKTVSCCRKDKAVNCCYKHKTVNGYRKFQVVNPCRKHIPVYRKCKIANRCRKYRLGHLCYRRSINYCACLNQRASVSVNCQGNRSYTPTQQLPRRANQPKLRIMLVYIPILSRHTL